MPLAGSVSMFTGSYVPLFPMYRKPSPKNNPNPSPYLNPNPSPKTNPNPSPKPNPNPKQSMDSGNIGPGQT